MATSRSCIKCLKSTCAIVFYCISWLKFCNLYMKKAVSQRCLWKKCSEKLLKIHRYTQEAVIERGSVKHRCSPVLKNICEGLLLKFIYKNPPRQMFSWEFCELFKNTYFVEDLRMASSETPVRVYIFLIKL